MTTTETDINGNTMYAAVKYPSGINRKWAEITVRLQCANCESNHIDSNLSGDLLMICCLDCENWWTGHFNNVYETNSDDRPIFRLPDSFDGKNRL
jgi:hypothetical protein